MRHDNHPDTVVTPPRLHLRQHALDGLRLRVVASGFHFHKEVRVDDEVLQRHGAFHPLRALYDVGGRGRNLVQVQMHHVPVQERDDGLQLFAGVCRRVHLAQHQADKICHVFVLVGNLKGEVAHVTSRLGHEAAGQVVQKIGLAAVGLSGGNYQSALVGWMEHPVGKRTVTHIVAVVVIAVQHVHNLIRTFAHGDDVRRTVRTCRTDNLAHHIGAVRHKHVGYVLAAAGQDGEQASRTEIVGKMLHKRSSGQVAVAANHQLLHPVQPEAESLETFGKVACRAVGHADDIQVARLAQGQHIPFPFGDNQARNILFGNQQRVDTVDVVRRARRGGRILAPAFGIAGSGGIARAVLHVDGLPVDIVHIGDALVHHPRSILFILSVLAVLASEAAVHQAADTCVNGCFQRDSHIGKITAGSKLSSIGGLRVIGQRLDFGDYLRRQPFVVFGKHRYLKCGVPSVYRCHTARLSFPGTSLCHRRSSRRTSGILPPRASALCPEVLQLPVKVAPRIKAAVQSRIARNGKMFFPALGTLCYIILPRSSTLGKITQIIKRLHPPKFYNL